MPGIGSTKIGVPWQKLPSGLPASLLAKFLFLWTGRYTGDNLRSELDGSVITVTGKDWTGRIIPPTTTATFAVPNNATYLAADGTDDWWFNGAGVLQQKTHADLIISETMRTFIKYDDFAPYNVSAIGILKDGEVLTDGEKIILNRFFKLWVQYWGPEMMLSGYMKDNRTFIEGPAENGLLYNWYAANNVNGVAPTGYHLPTKIEFDALLTFLGGDAVAGGKMKESGTDHWNTPNTGADNSSGFTAFGAGGRSREDGSFIYFKETASFWASTLNWIYEVVSSDTLCSSSNLPNVYRKYGASIRCIRDTAVGWVPGETATDYDGNIYDTVQIGTQIWLVQNLATTHYNNGDPIPEVTDAAAWAALVTGGMCAYNNDWSEVFE